MKPMNLSADAAWRKRFQAPVYVSSQLASQDAGRGMVVTNKDGVYQLYAWDVSANSLTQITDSPTGKGVGYISADGQRIYWLQDDGGNEIGHYHLKNVITGEVRDVTPNMPAYASFYFTECYSGRYYGFVTANQFGFTVYVVDNFAGGDPLFRYESQHVSIGPMLSYDGEIAIIASNEKTGTTEYALEAYDVKTGAKLHELWDGAGTGIQPVGFAKRPGDMRFLATTNASGHNRPFIWNARTGERTELNTSGIEGDLNLWDWSRDGRYILMNQVHQARTQLYLYDTTTHSVSALNHPAGQISGGYFSSEGTIFAHMQDSTHPLRLVELGGLTGEFKRELLGADDIPAGTTWRSVTYNAYDGTPIQAWLATPEGEGPFATIVHTHGGPTSVTMEMFNAQSQTWLDHGFAFFSINYRGSTTFGRDFQHAIDGNLGDLEVEDVAAGVEWLIAQGIAQPGHLLKTGGSYGGYLTLQTLGKKPDLFAGGMAFVAIADWVLMYEDQAETLRGYQRALFGGTPEEKPDAHRKSSPITYAEALKAELLIIQGRNDTRCPERQMRVFEERLIALGRPPQIEWFDAGHGSLKVDEQIHHMELMLNFAYREYKKHKPPILKMPADPV